MMVVCATSPVQHLPMQNIQNSEQLSNRVLFLRYANDLMNNNQALYTHYPDKKLV